MEVLIDLKPISEQVLILDNLLLLNAADVTKLPNLKRFDSLGIMLLICAAVPIVVAGYSMIAALMFVNRAERAEGLIVELKTEAPWPGKGISTFPLIEFADSSGLKHRAELRSYLPPRVLERL